ncbi:hypothetical protein FVE85_2181 [Porphyridium purpureum]|uniref:Uncharacterized protein n=1 Tax=Porphyridium purpureum TaxID=35688 RepID=A0A5J4YXF3_PORPP|nr:hypothetical protein FVE85_2181 [Porphyridium purpureum]|eukprot:POR9024..scf209_3
MAAEVSVLRVAMSAAAAAASAAAPVVSNGIFATMVGLRAGSVMSAMGTAACAGATTGIARERVTLNTVVRRNLQASAKNSWQDNGEGRDRHSSLDSDDVSDGLSRLSSWSSSSGRMGFLQNWNSGKSTSGSLSRRDAHALKQVREEFATLEYIQPTSMDEKIGLQYVVGMASVQDSQQVAGWYTGHGQVSSKRIAKSLQHFALFARASGGGVTCVEPLRHPAFCSALMQEAHSLKLPTCVQSSAASWEHADPKVLAQILLHADRIVLRDGDRQVSVQDKKQQRGSFATL